MTIAIAFTCKDGLFIASDSQMSFGENYKQWDEPKISALKFAGGHYAVMAIAGSLDGARCFQEILEQLAPAHQVTNDRAIADVGELALKETRSKLLAYIGDATTTAEERAAHLANHDFEALLAYFSGVPPQPFIYKLKLHNGIAVKGCHTFEATGCGTDVAGFILTGGDFKKYERDEAACLAIYAVEMCKKFDQACGGPVQQMLLSKEPHAVPTSVSPEVMAILEDAVRKQADSIHLTATQMILSSVHDKYHEMLSDIGK